MQTLLPHKSELAGIRGVIKMYAAKAHFHCSILNAILFFHIVMLFVLFFRISLAFKQVNGTCLHLRLIKVANMLDFSWTC